MRKYVIGGIIAALVAVTFATLPQIDSVQPDVLYYLKSLTPLYYVSVAVTAIVAIRYRRSLLGLFSVALLGLLVLWTPSIVMVQPWFLDSYPFATEAAIVSQTGHLSSYHFLSVNPVIGLIMGPFMSVTGVSVIVLQKLYTAFLSVFLVGFVYLIAKAVKLRKDLWVIAPLLFVSIAWPNEFHLSRQSFSLIFYVACLLLLLTLIFKKFDRRVFALLVLQLFLVVMAHPATSLFLIANLLVILVYAQLRHKLDGKELRTIALTLAILSAFWALWNSLVTTEAVNDLINIVNNLSSSLLRNPQSISGLARIFSGYSPLYGLLINVRLVVTLGIFASAFLILLLTFRRREDGKIIAILAGWTAVNVCSAIPLLYSGLSFFARPALFSFFAWSILGALVFGLLSQKNGKWVLAKKVGKYAFLVLFVIVPLFLIPIIKYSPMPFIYPSSQELAQKNFSDLHPDTNAQLFYLEYNLPYGISYTRYGINETEGYAFGDIFIPGEGLNSTFAADSILWVTNSLTMRDGFFDSTPSMIDVVGNLSLNSITRNRVYDGGWSQWILTPTFINPNYQRLIPTQISCAVNVDNITLGGSVRAFGSLTASMPTGAFPLANRTVTVTYHVSGQVDVVHAQTTSYSGGYSDSYTPTVVGNWTVTATFAGDSTYIGSNNAAQTLIVTASTGNIPLIFTEISCSINVDNITVGGSVRAFGILTASTSAGAVPLADKTVTVTYHVSGQVDVVHAQTTDSSGVYNDSFAPDVIGEWSVTATFVEDSTYLGSNNAAQTLSVR